jgi:poly(3-hydroxybutyrate) depolymerase
MTGIVPSNSHPAASGRLRRFLGDNSTMKCGETKRTLKMPECEDSNDCDRSYYLFVPPSQCTGEKDILPLVFAIHCFGCNYNQMIHWEAVATDLNFALVIPEGIHNSWNAKYCCGHALEKGLDDVGFFNSIIQELAHEFSFVSKEITYAMGWSNGGYMAAYAARLFRAVAPISGHDYDPQFIDKPTALFMHHSSNDPVVRETGCCTDSTMPQCCCGISDQSHQCRSATDVFENWAKTINKCSGDFETSYKDESRQISCRTGVDCAANTTYCVHKAQHFNTPSFEKAFPMTNEIGDFFARDACGIHGGMWSPQWRNCSCDTANGRGTYCLVGADTESSASASLLVGEESVARTGSSAIVATGVVFLLGLVVLVKTRATRWKYAGWMSVPVEDERSS